MNRSKQFLTCPLGENISQSFVLHLVALPLHAHLQGIGHGGLGAALGIRRIGPGHRGGTLPGFPLAAFLLLRSAHGAHLLPVFPSMGKGGQKNPCGNDSARILQSSQKAADHFFEIFRCPARSTGRYRGPGSRQAGSHTWCSDPARPWGRP